MSTETEVSRSGFTLEVVVHERQVLFVGRVPEPERKLLRLLASGARVTWVNDGAGPLDLGASRDAVTFLDRAAEDLDLEGKALVFVAPPSSEAELARAARWRDSARARGALLCVLDRPELSTFTNVAALEASGLAVTVGSHGASPALARRLREGIEELLSDPRLGRFVARLAELRRSLPRGERAARGSEAVQGFAVRGELSFPEWFTRADDGP